MRACDGPEWSGAVAVERSLAQAGGRDKGGNGENGRGVWEGIVTLDATIRKEGCNGEIRRLPGIRTRNAGREGEELRLVRFPPLPLRGARPFRNLSLASGRTLRFCRWSCHAKPCVFPCAGMGRAGSPCPPAPEMPTECAGDARTHVSRSFWPNGIRTSNVIRWSVPATGGEGTRRPTRLRTRANTWVCPRAGRHLGRPWCRTGNRNNRSVHPGPGNPLPIPRIPER